MRVTKLFRCPFAGTRRVRLLVVAAAAVVTAVGTHATAASASTPTQGTFSFHNVFVDADVCAPEGFAINAVEDESGHYQVFFDRNGDVASTVVHFDYQATISANGHTIVERDKWILAFYSDGTARVIGNSVHIQGPGAGLVQHDAGQVIFNADGSITIHGPHPQFEGQTFCFALLP